MSLQETLQGLESKILNPSSWGTASLQESAQELESLSNRFDALCHQQQMSSDDLAVVQKAAGSINLVASFFLRVEEGVAAILEKTKKDTSSVDLSFRTATASVGGAIPDSLTTMIDTADSLQSHLMRRYFLDHLDDPYPTQDEKDDIVRQTNAAIRQHPTYQAIKHTKRGEINDERLMLWFINARRRSGWQALKREFGGDDRVRTGRIIRAFLREQGRAVKGRPGEQGDSLAELIAPGRDPMTDEVQQRIKKLTDDIETIELYLRHGIKQKVRGWMQDVIQGAKEDQRREKAKKAGVKERKASTAATKAKSKPTAKTKAKPAPSKPRPAARQGTRASARIARSTTRAVAYHEQSETGSDDEPPMTAKPSQPSFESAQLHDLDNRSLYGNALGLGLPSTARYHPAARDSSNGSLTSTDSSQASTSFDPQGSRYGYSRASSVTSYSSFDEALEALQPETAPPTAKRIIRPLPSRSPPSALLYTDFADLAAADLGPRRPISSSPTNSQEVHDRFIHEQPSDSDCSPAALPLLLPRIPA